MAASVHPGSSHPDPLSSAGLTAAAGGQIRLRRAVYVHVSDLTSAYDIDHAKLEEELARVRKERQETLTARESAAVAAAADSLIDSNSYPQKRLQPPRGGYNLCVLVGKVNVVVDKKRVDGSRVRLAEVEVGDETGIVSLRARDDQIDVLQEVSARNGAVVLRNCMLELYQGKHIRLAVTKWGKLNTYPDTVASTPPAPSKMNFDRNFSLIDLSIVASESSAALVAAGQPFPTSALTTAGPTGTASALQQPSDNAASRTAMSSSKTLSSSRQSSTQPYQQPHLQQGGKRGSGRGNGGGGVSSNRHSVRNSRTGSQQQQQQAPTLQHAGGIHYAPEPMAAAVAIGRGYAMHQVGIGWHDPTTTPQPPLDAVPPYQTHHGYASAPGTDAAASITQHQQQMLLRQQYEMQQRQLHQMYQQHAQHAHHQHAHQEQERQRQMQHQHQHQHQHTLAKSTSFGQDQPPMLPSGMVGSSPLLMPMSTMSQPPPMILHSQQQQQQQQQQQHLHTQYQQPLPSSATATTVDGSPDRNQNQPTTSEEPPMSPNKMNPQAATFAPGYSTGTSGAEPAGPAGTYPALPPTTSKTSNNNKNKNIPPPASASSSSMPMTYAAAAYDHSQQQLQPSAPSSGGQPGFHGGQQQPQHQHQHQSRHTQRHHGGHHYHPRHHGGGGQQQLHGSKQGGSTNRK